MATKVRSKRQVAERPRVEIVRDPEHDKWIRHELVLDQDAFALAKILPPLPPPTHNPYSWDLNNERMIGPLTRGEFMRLYCVVSRLAGSPDDEDSMIKIWNELAASLDFIERVRGFKTKKVFEERRKGNVVSLLEHRDRTVMKLARGAE